MGFILFFDPMLIDDPLVNFLPLDFDTEAGSFGDVGSRMFIEFAGPKTVEINWREEH
ncbi:hypothetical protein Hanom_Chr03g00231931 [Helianthus anomalus]